MDRWRLGLWDRDAGYVRSLGRYIRERAGERLEVRVFTSEDALRMCLDEGGLEGVLAGDAVLSVCREYPGLWTALLAEREEEVSEEAFPVIGKYQSAEQIWRRILETGGAGALRVKKETEREILGLCSPSQGARLLALGLFMSRILAEAGRSLFLTLDAFARMPEELSAPEAEGELSELYYYYCQGKLDGPRIQTALGRWGRTDWAVPAERPEDLCGRDRSYEPEFFLELAEAGDYRYLVLELGGGLPEKEAVLSQCGRLLVPVPREPWERQRTEALLGWLEGRGFGERIVRCGFPVFGEGAGFCSLEREYAGAAGAQVRKLLEEQGYLTGGEDGGGRDQKTAFVPAGSGRRDGRRAAFGDDR